MRRDALTHGKLMDTDWRIAVIWECAIKGRTRLNFDFLIDQLEDWIMNPKSKGIELTGASETIRDLTVRKHGSSK